MRLHRLKVNNFGGITNADIAFGPGLNVLFGPNDLGKSTIADAIRLALLLPHASTTCEPYVPWAGGGDPVVELTFATEEQRIWRVRKRFGKSGSSVLEESRDGNDFDEVDRGRAVDAKLREVVRWGIPEPGGSGGGRGLPSSFLSTALLSTQADVSAVLTTSLEADIGGGGRDRIAAALQAIAQDPLFLLLLRKTQERWDEAYTEKGNKSRAKGSVFAGASERVNQARDEKESLQKVVDESEVVEQGLRKLIAERSGREEVETGAAERLHMLETLAAQAEACKQAADQARVALEAVDRIKQLADDVVASERSLATLTASTERLEAGRDLARAAVAVAAETLKSSEAEARSATLAAEMTDTVARQQLELRKAVADRAATAAQQALGSAIETQKLVDAATAAERELTQLGEQATDAREEAAKRAEMLAVAQAALDHCEELDRGLAIQLADRHLANCETEVAKKTALAADLVRLSVERDSLLTRRKRLVVPVAAFLPPLRKLEKDLAGARASLGVGLVATVTPRQARLELRLGRDGIVPISEVITQSLDAEAESELFIGIADVATIQVRGGKPDAREYVRSLEDRWTLEAAPHLTAAGVQDLVGLEEKIEEARDLETQLASLNREINNLQVQTEALAETEVLLREAALRASGVREGLAEGMFESLASELQRMGGDPGVTLRSRRQRASGEVEAARKASADAATAQMLTLERERALRERRDKEKAASDVALSRFPEGLSVAAANAQAALVATKAELLTVTKDLASVHSAQDERARRLDESVRSAREAEVKSRAAVDAAERAHTDALTTQALEGGRLAELRKRLASEDLVAAETTAHSALAASAALPVPERSLVLGELEAARAALATVREDITNIDREIQRSQGALEQVGGAVARERLYAAVEAFDQAERHERELEADYEAWKLLLETMKEADAAQASNLGQVLAPAITKQFGMLTALRYQGVQLTAQLGTEGVLVEGNLRSYERISVGTREQLSTLYRLCLGEYLRTAVVLDDQLVQSDEPRMDWFRSLLARNARTFQIVVFTCRPGDYLSTSSMPTGETVYVDSDDGFIRAFDMGRAVQRR